MYKYWENIMKLKVKAKLKIFKNLLFFFGLILLTYWLIFKDQDINELINVLKSIDIKWALLGIFIMLIYYLLEAINIRSILKIFDEKISIFSALKFTLIGFFFSSITPAATGGQPVEIYYMTKEKISGSKATLALLIQLCGFQISTISYGLVCSIFYWNILNKFFWLFLLGLAINGFALTLMLIGIFSEKLTKKLINFLIKIMNLLKMKNVNTKCDKIKEELKKYNHSAIFIKSHMYEFVKAILRVFVQIAFYYSVPYCIYKSFGLNTYNLIQIFAMQAVVYTTTSGFPLPGAIGISETVFLSVFGVAFGSTLLSGAMLLSRGITFYLFVIISLLVVIINAFEKKNIKGEIDNEMIEFETDY